MAFFFHPSSGAGFLMNQLASLALWTQVPETHHKTWRTNEVVCDGILAWLKDRKNGAERYAPGADSPAILRFTGEELAHFSSTFGGVVTAGAWRDWVPPSILPDLTKVLYLRGQPIRVERAPGCGVIFNTTTADMYLLNATATNNLPASFTGPASTRSLTAWQNDQVRCDLITAALDAKVTSSFAPGAAQAEVYKISGDAVRQLTFYIGECLTFDNGSWGDPAVPELLRPLVELDVGAALAKLAQR